MTDEKALATLGAPGSVQTSYSLGDIEKIGTILAQSKLFGVKTPEQAVALCLIAHAEGQHPAMAALDYDIIQGTPALKSKALLARFQAAGGNVEWKIYTDEEVEGVFTHPQGGTVTIKWDNDRVKRAGLDSRDMHKKWPRQMKRARCISEGVTTVWPGAAKLYVPEEVIDFDKPKTVGGTSSRTSKPKPKPKPKDEPAEPIDTKATSDIKLIELNCEPENGLPDDDLGAINKSFKAYGITTKDLEAVIGQPTDRWGEIIKQELRELMGDLQRGEKTPEQFQQK